MTAALGATVEGAATRFVVWAPHAQRSVALVVDGRPAIELESVPPDPGSGRSGYWQGVVDGIGHGDRYRYSLDGGEPLPDPCSAWQPDGVHGPSAVVDTARFAWTDDAWRGRGLVGAVLYELHVGTFTTGGTFDSAIAELARLAELGITTIEVMPVNAFPGEHNWGYDGVLPWAVQHSYGGPEALARFVDAAHGHGIAVLLDVVYNHQGPEGNHLDRFGPYFTDEFRTPWGPAVNVVGRGSDGVRRYYVDNAVRWIRDFHVDGFRFDAVHAIVDPTANPFWAEVGTAVRAVARSARREVVLTAETSDNDPRQLAPVEHNGFGFDGVWADAVHHSLRVALTGQQHTYYFDYDGTPTEFADIVTHRWKFRGQYSIARDRRHGRPVDHVAPHRFVATTQNHDQVGNRPAGDRPDHHMTADQRRFAPAALLLSPYTPMLFMGEEYGELRPFPFFVDHQDPTVLRGTNEGRRAEFAGSDWSVGVPEPGARTTFESAILDRTVVARDDRAMRLQAMYTELLRLRRDLTPITSPAASQRVVLQGAVVHVIRSIAGGTTVQLINMSDATATVVVAGALAFTSDDERWGGTGRSRLGDGELTLSAWTVALVVDRS